MAVIADGPGDLDREQVLDLVGGARSSGQVDAPRAFS
jgi:hypothetical protein